MSKKEVGPVGPFRWRPFGIIEATGRRVIKVEIPYEDFTLTLIAVVGLDYGIVFQYFEIDKTKSVTAGMLQRIKLGELREEIAKSLVRNPSLLDWGALILDFVEKNESVEWTELPSEDALTVMETAREDVRRLVKLLKDYQPRRGRAAENPGLYRMVAELYLELLPDHGQRVIEAMTTELGKPKNTVSGWVRKSRDNYWLTPAPAQGRAGGEAGQRLIEWRKENES